MRVRRTASAAFHRCRETVDCIIAALAEEADCPLLARDSDMDAILDSGLLKADRWPVTLPDDED